LTKEILVVHRYFPPDESSCGRIIKKIAVYLIKNGYNVSIITGKPSYRYNENSNKNIQDADIGAFVIRVELPKEINRSFIRIFNAFWLGIYSFFKILQKKYDVIIVTSMPPILTAFIVTLAAKIRGVRVIYQYMDIYPEIGLLSGDLSDNLITKLMYKIDTYTMRKADTVLVYSNDMRNALRKRPSAHLSNIQRINLFGETSGMTKKTILPSHISNIESKFTIIYAGNIGRFQNLDLILDIFNLVDDEKIELIFLGDGVMLEQLKMSSKNCSANIKFLGHKSPEDAITLIDNADICLVSAISNLLKFAFPSKTITYLERSKPILALIDHKSELAKTILSSKIGFLLDMDNPLSSSQLICHIAKDTKWKKDMEINAKNLYSDKFSPDKVLLQWTKLIEK